MRKTTNLRIVRVVHRYAKDKMDRDNGGRSGTLYYLMLQQEVEDDDGGRRWVKVPLIEREEGDEYQP